MPSCLHDDYARAGALAPWVKSGLPPGLERFAVGGTECFLRIFDGIINDQQVCAAAGQRAASFQTLLSDLATLAKNRIVPTTHDPVPFDLFTTPTPIQQRAFDLLHVNYRM